MTKLLIGNSKSLWDATRIAMDKECIDIPEQVHNGQYTYKNEDIPEAFANYFMDKVETIAQSTVIDEDVFNKIKILINLYRQTTKRNSLIYLYDMCSIKNNLNVLLFRTQ